MALPLPGLITNMADAAYHAEVARLGQEHGVTSLTPLPGMLSPFEPSEAFGLI